METLKNLSLKNRSQYPNILPPLKQEAIRKELTPDQEEEVNKTIQPLFKHTIINSYNLI